MRKQVTTNLSCTDRAGFTAVEMAAVGVVLVLLAGILVPLVLSSRETARKNSCANNIARLVKALEIYHDQHISLPPAADWNTGKLQSVALHQSQRWDLFIQKNWAVLLLPELGQRELSDQFKNSLPISAPAHEALRTTRVADFQCASDGYNRADNPYRFEPSNDRTVEFARGNYAINGGTNSFHTTAGSTATPTGDYAHLLIDVEGRQFQSWGNGIAGFNKAFRFDEFRNGRSTLVAIEEVRAGIHSVDPRGAWALGQIATSVTWGHGVNGDDYGPNNPWARADDICGCAQLHEAFGEQELVRLGMPCVSYIDLNQNATSRSQHSGGVNVGFLDGAVRFVKNDIDPALWHVMHSRETPSEILEDNFATRISWTGSNVDYPAPDRGLDLGSSTENEQKIRQRFQNSLRMEFISIPAGQFQMGTPDPGSGEDLPKETPVHLVKITSPFFLDSTEVTQEQYLQVMGENPSWHQPPHVEENWSPQFPVENITWDQANEFCRKLSERAEERAAGRSYRLPTEAEWEYACRAGSSESQYATISRGEPTGAMAGDRGAGPLGEVKKYAANEFGLYDMRGNAWEWCSDWFDRDYYQRSPVEDPAGPADGYMKVVRGADWIYVGEGCFINYPILAPWKSSRVIGFRVVCIRKTNPDSK